MYKKFLNFVKYNNITVIIFLAALVIGGGAMASEGGRELIGQPTTRQEGIDNTILLEMDLDNFFMDFKIEKIEEDENYYYVTYSFLDLDIIDNAWQTEYKEKNRKVSKKLKEDLGVYLAKEFKQEYDARIKELKAAQAQAQLAGEQTRVQVSEYSGLIGKTLDITATLFDGYEPVKKVEVPSPEIDLTIKQNINSGSQADDLYQIYQDYVTGNVGVSQLSSGPTPPQTTAATTSTSTTATAAE